VSDDDRSQFTPLDAVEMAHTMAGLGKGIWSFYSGLIEEGFTDEQAMRIALQYVHGLAGGKLS
jgi:hypothetical protein